jgi:hypothetical protein
VAMQRVTRSSFVTSVGAASDRNVDCDEIPLVDVGRVGRAMARTYWYRTSCADRLSD